MMANKDFIDALENLLRISALSIESEDETWISARLCPRIGDGIFVIYSGSPLIAGNGRVMIGIFDHNYDLQIYSLREYMRRFVGKRLSIEISTNASIFDWES